LELKEIIERLQKIRADIEGAFKKELIDFDEMESGISSVIEAIQNLNSPEKSGDRITLNPGNYTK
jgi:prefoldin subunit 5